MLDAFLEGVKTVEDVSVDVVDINQIPMEYHRFEVYNPKDEEIEFKAVVEKLQNTNALVIATPTYNFNVPSNLKNFIDRITYVALNKKKLNILRQPIGQLSHCKTFYLVSGGSPWLVEKLLFFIFPIFWLRVIFTYYGARLGGGIYGGSLTFSNPASERLKLLEKCRKAGRRFAKKL